MLSRGQTLNETVDETAAVELLMQPGDVSFHHTLLAHRSGPNRTQSPRIGVGLSYIPAHVKRGLTIIEVEHMDDVLPAALSHADLGAHLQEGDHSIDEIYEVPLRDSMGDLEIPAEVN